MRRYAIPNSGTIAAPAFLARLMMALVLLVSGFIAEAQTTPVISSFSPTSGPAGTVVTVYGSGLGGVLGAELETQGGVAVRNVTATSLQFTINNTFLSGRVRVYSSCCATFSTGTFTVTGDQILRPAVSGFSPTSGPVGTVITVTGTNLQQVTRAGLGRGVDTTVSSVSSTSLKFVLPAKSATGPIRVINPAYDAFSKASFTVTTGTATATPVISSFSPTSGPSGTVVTVTGSGFTGATSASINGGTAVPVSSVTSTSLRFTVPSGATSGTIRISNG